MKFLCNTTLLCDFYSHVVHPKYVKNYKVSLSFYHNMCVLYFMTTEYHCQSETDPTSNFLKDQCVSRSRFLNVHSVYYWTNSFQLKLFLFSVLTLSPLKLPSQVSMPGSPQSDAPGNLLCTVINSVRHQRQLISAQRR